jgi:subtilisin family serine protease
MKELESGGPADEHAVIIRLKEAIDHRSLRASVVNMARPERVKKVVQELKTRAERSQQDLRTHLSMQERLGRVKKLKPFWIFNGVAVTATAETIKELAARVDVAEVVQDRVITLGAPVPAPAEAPTGWNLDRIGVKPLWNAGFRGQGVVVANLDTGVDITHPDIGPKWRGGVNSWLDPFNQTTGPYDVQGHGTWTMGIIVGGDSSGTAVGVAPESQWIAAKIFDDQGNSLSSVIHQGFSWVLDPDENPNTNDAPDVVNCSWDLNNPGTADQEFQTDVQVLRAAGIAVVFSAGNAGPNGNTSVSPGNYPESFSAGMTDDTDAIDMSSSRGPSAYDGTSIYPAVVAPGDGITTTDLWFGSPNLSYITVSGTSFSAPHVAGALALLLSGNPALTDVQLEDAIKQTAWDLGETGPDNDYGHGFLDVERAARQLNVLPPAIAGDVDGSGLLELNDVLIELRAAIGFPTTVVEMNRIVANGDVFPLGGPDGMIAPADALTLLRMYVAAQ